MLMITIALVVHDGYINNIVLDDQTQKISITIHRFKKYILLHKAKNVLWQIFWQTISSEIGDWSFMKKEY